MYGLPLSTERKQQLPKKAIYAKFEWKPAQREHFDADISRMTLVNMVSPHTVPALAEGSEVKSFYVLSVQLKRKDYDARNITILARLIPQHLIFVLQCDDEYQLAVFQERLFVSAWSSFCETKHLPLQGFDLDKVWTNLVTHVGDFSLQGENTLKAQIQQDETQAKLQKQIDALEKKCRAERQPRRKQELFEELKRLKQVYNGKV